MPGIMQFSTTTQHPNVNQRKASWHLKQNMQLLCWMCINCAAHGGDVVDFIKNHILLLWLKDGSRYTPQFSIPTTNQLSIQRTLL